MEPPFTSSLYGGIYICKRHPAASARRMERGRGRGEGVKDENKFR